MREIKFRGKTGSREWVYGDLTISPYGTPYIGALAKKWSSVREYTVGQYTGVKDSNGKEIYEGDIIHCYDGRCRIVEWVQDNGSWELQMLPHGDYVDPFFFGEFEVGEWVVIGNRWDNPELLGGTHDE